MLPVSHRQAETHIMCWSSRAVRPAPGTSPAEQLPLDRVQAQQC